jgi:hypothetical protein
MTDKVRAVFGRTGPTASRGSCSARPCLFQPASTGIIPRLVLSLDPQAPDQIVGRRGTGPDPLPWLLRGVNDSSEAGHDEANIAATPRGGTSLMSIHK